MPYFDKINFVCKLEKKPQYIWKTTSKAIHVFEQTIHVTHRATNKVIDSKEVRCQSDLNKYRFIIFRVFTFITGCDFRYLRGALRIAGNSSTS